MSEQMNQNPKQNNAFRRYHVGRWTGRSIAVAAIVPLALTMAIGGASGSTPTPPSAQSAPVPSPEIDGSSRFVVKRVRASV